MPSHTCFSNSVRDPLHSLSAQQSLVPYGCESEAPVGRTFHGNIVWIDGPSHTELHLLLGWEREGYRVDCPGFMIQFRVEVCVCGVHGRGVMWSNFKRLNGSVVEALLSSIISSESAKSDQYWLYSQNGKTWPWTCTQEPVVWIDRSDRTRKASDKNPMDWCIWQATT